MKTVSLIVAAALLASPLLSGAAQAGIGEELTLAQTQALLAYRFGGRGPERAVQNLQHVLNCLVGPGGEGYNITPPNTDPCAADKTNKGAINDAVNPAQKAKIVAIVAQVKADMTITDGPKLQDAATALADAIGEAKQ